MSLQSQTEDRASTPLSTDRHFHTNATLRTTTIAAGAILGVALVLTNFYTATSGASSSTAQDIFNAVVFGGPIVWFATNAIRWLQERLPRPANHIVFAIIAAFAFGISARAIYDITVDPPNQTADAVYQAVLAAALMATGLVALASAVQRPGTTEPISLKQTLLGTESETEPTPTALTHAARWLAILGGIAFAASVFVSPTVIPVAIVLTCAVRYACTLNTSRTIQTVALVAAAAAVAVIHIGLAVLFPEEQQWFAYTLLPSAISFGSALLIGFVALRRALLSSRQ